jgi:glutamate carboxypeptidase
VQTRLQAQLPEALELLRQMVNQNSWTENRDGVNRLGRFTADAFTPLGFAAEFIPSIDARYGDHLALRRPGTSRKSIALISHLDTVFPPEEEARNQFHWQPEGDRIYGPGTEDIKGGTVILWQSLRALKEFYPRHFEAVTWHLCWNSSEEVLSTDFGELCRHRFDEHTLAALVFESEGRQGADRRVVVARKGRATWRATVTGRGAHAGVCHASGANAVVQLGRTVEQIASLSDYSQELTFNPATISGGSGLNRVPHAAAVAGEFRAFDPQIYATAKARLLALNGPGTVKSAQDAWTTQVHIEITDESPPWPRNAKTDHLLSVWQAAGAEVGLRFLPEERGGLSDGNQMWDVVPTLDGLGPTGYNAHCSERSADGTKVPEYVEVSSFVPKALTNVLALKRLIEAEGLV